MTSLATQGRAGVPGPDRWIHHEELTASKGIQNTAALCTGAACTNGTPLSALVTIAGASRARCRIKTTCDGVLKFEFVRPLNGRLIVTYAADNPATGNITANTEDSLTTTDIAGESQMLITFTPSGDGAVTFVDFMAL